VRFVRVLVIALVAAPAVVLGPAGAAGAPQQTLPMSAASLAQEGQDLVWQVELAQPFSPGGLIRAHRSLCLEIDQDTVEREMLAGGDMIGDHTWGHPDMLGLSAADQRRQISLAAEAIRKATGGFEPCLFRAPDGAVDPRLLKLARSMGFSTIQWDIDPRDWALPGESEIIDVVLRDAHDGGIIEAHFGLSPWRFLESMA